LDSALFSGTNWTDLTDAGNTTLHKHDIYVPIGDTSYLREKLTAARTYYVRTDGNDSNTGLINNSGGAFLTIQKAINVVAVLDIGAHNVTITVIAGTYTAGGTVGAPFFGTGTVLIVGDNTTPSNCHINVTSAHGFTASNHANFNVSGFKISTTTAGNCLYAMSMGRINIVDNMEFGACAWYHMQAEGYGQIELNTVGADYIISGGAAYHALAVAGGIIRVLGNTVTLSGTPAFTAYAYAWRLGLIEMFSNTFSGSATGQRYNAAGLGLIFTNGGASTYLPGDSGGATSTGGEYA
jgi:hypothetical protein